MKLSAYRFIILLASVFQIVISIASKEYLNLVKWIKDNGGYISQKLLPIEESISNRYIASSEKIKKNEEIVFIPEINAISLINKRVNPICKKAFTSIDDNYFNCIMLFVSIDMKNKKSFFSPYYEYLPKNSKFILDFSTEEKKEFSKTELKEHLRDIEALLNSSYLEVKDNLPSNFSYSEYKKNYLLMRSRNFNRRNSNIPEVDSMVPFLDLFNHDNDYDADFFYDDMRDGYYLVSVKDIEPYKQIHISYGVTNNHYLFDYYCFTIKDNKFRTTLHFSFGNDNFILFNENRNKEIDEKIKIFMNRYKFSYTQAIFEIKNLLNDKVKNLQNVNTLNIKDFENIVYDEKDSLLKYINILDNLSLK